MMNLVYGERLLKNVSSTVMFHVEKVPKAWKELVHSEQESFPFLTIANPKTGKKEGVTFLMLPHLVAGRAATLVHLPSS